MRVVLGEDARLPTLLNMVVAWGLVVIQRYRTGGVVPVLRKGTQGSIGFLEDFLSPKTNVRVSR